MRKKHPKNIREKHLRGFLDSQKIALTAGKFLLLLLALGGVAIAGAVAPGLVILLKEFGYSERYSRG